MRRTTAGKCLLTFLLGVLPPINVIADWNQTHVFNPTWPPHARFHAAWGSVLAWSVVAIAIWLLWRRSTEPEVGAKVALLVQLAIWTPFFYLTLVVRGTSLDDGAPPVVQHKIAGMVIEPQVVVAIIFILLTVWGYRLASRNSRAKEPSAQRI
jgi:hypothetical protein